MERINILWTGGFDSTYRVCQLSLLEVEIQPFYIRLKRESEPYELKAIADITGVIRKNKATKCTLLPLAIINQDEILPDEDIKNSMKELCKRGRLGTQYDELTRFARQNGIKLEVGFELNPSTRVRGLFEGIMKKETIPLRGGEVFEFLELDGDKCPKDVMNIFGNFRYGLPLYWMTKLQVMDSYKEMGYEEVISLTWFCAHPLNGKPCGLCTPCEEAMLAHMNFRFSARSRILYKVFKTNYIGRAIDKKLKAIYNKRIRKRK